MRVRVTTKGGRTYRTSQHEAERLLVKTEAKAPEKQVKAAKKKEKRDADQKST